MCCCTIDDDEKRDRFTLQLYWLRKEDKGIPEVPVDVDIPHEFLCPITHEIMHDPVLSSGKGNTSHASGVTDTQSTGISPSDSHPFQSFFSCDFPLPQNSNICTYKACSKKGRTSATKPLFYNIVSTVLFKVVLSTGDTPSPTFVPLLECFLECTFYEGVQFSYRIFLNLCVFKKRPNFLNSLPTST